MPSEALAATILVVDDEPPLLRLVARVLEKQGFSVLTAANGIEAIVLFDKHFETIDAVLLDIVIPPNGVAEVMDHIVAKRPDVVLVLSSGDRPESEIAAKIKTHGGAFLRKPFLPRALLELIDSRLEAKRAAASESDGSGSEEPVPGLEREEY